MANKKSEKRKNDETRDSPKSSSKKQDQKKTPPAPSGDSKDSQKKSSKKQKEPSSTPSSTPMYSEQQVLGLLRSQNQSSQAFAAPSTQTDDNTEAKFTYVSICNSVEIDQVKEETWQMFHNRWKMEPLVVGVSYDEQLPVEGDLPDDEEDAPVVMMSWDLSHVNQLKPLLERQEDATAATYAEQVWDVVKKLENLYTAAKNKYKRLRYFVLVLDWSAKEGIRHVLRRGGPKNPENLRQYLNGLGFRRPPAELNFMNRNLSEMNTIFVRKPVARTKPDGTTEVPTAAEIANNKVVRIFRAMCEKNKVKISHSTSSSSMDTSKKSVRRVLKKKTDNDTKYDLN